ncbi:glycosyltransferase family 61 protein [Coraliomargarita parva]|uniref:glycosyltransferase family 61 protein n=1 Tax=Coraliomargarita parva TaxID=3014050 RepID=UPI0022B3CF34|nr:glycosyltransferase family 61 protein [Coraliomargarita parva]
MSKLSKKLNQARTRFVSRYVPKNTALRPTGIAGASNPPEGVTYHPVLSGVINSLDIPDALYERLSPFGKPAERSVSVDYRVAEITNGRIFNPNEATVAVISSDNRLLGDMSFNYAMGRVVSPELNKVFQLSNFPNPKHCEGTVFSLLTGGGGANNYAHWLIDSLSRLHLLRLSGLYDSVDRFLVPEPRYDFQADSLKYLGIDRSQLITDAEHHHFTADRLITSTAPRGDSVIIPKWVTDFHREAFLKARKLRDFEAPLVYVRRSDSSMRNVLNEDALVAHLAERGFRSFEMASLPFLDKIALFAGAQVVVSVHGAGLANIMFCPESAHFVELFPEQFVLTTYADLAFNVGLGYSHMLCPSPVRAKDGKEGQKVHVTVDIDALDALLDPVLEKLKAS